MNFRKIFLIFAFLAIFGWFFGRNIQTARAQTMEEISAQISALQVKIAAYQKEVIELQARISTIQNEIVKLRAEMAKLLGKQIFMIQNQIAQLQQELSARLPTKPESEYKCPDINKDGIVDIYDSIILSGAMGTCVGNAKYDSRGDFDGDGCITSTDSNYLQKYFGKKIEDITQCKGVITLKPESEYKCPDVNRDGVVDVVDMQLVKVGLDTCKGDLKYEEKEDFDGNGCITSTDYDFVKKYVGKLTGTITQCTGIVIVPTKPESEYKCPDVNRDGVVDVVDMQLVKVGLDTCKGDLKYEEKEDFDGNGCITSTDYDFVKKYVGKLTGTITQCTGIVIVPTKPESEYKCPDINKDGIVDIYDSIILSGAMGTCVGNAKYDSRGDFDGDGCITSTDSNYLQKYFGKKIEDITQCKGETTLKYIERMIASISDTISKISEGLKELRK
jgi:hypothetical protein